MARERERFKRRIDLTWRYAHQLPPTFLFYFFVCPYKYNFVMLFSSTLLCYRYYRNKQFAWRWRDSCVDHNIAKIFKHYQAVSFKFETIYNVWLPL
ncbi:hypothetical protein ACOSP7_002544 [Xanthoceras sorbifolium]